MNVEAVQQLLDAGIPLTHFIGLEVQEVEPGYVRMRMPFGPNALNHLGTVYAGATFALAEISGGVAVISAFDASEYLMVARSLEITYRRPGRSDLFCEARLSPALIAETRVTVAEHGKADLPLTIEVTDAEGEGVARVQAVYHLRHTPSAVQATAAA